MEEFYRWLIEYKLNEVVGVNAPYTVDNFARGLPGVSSTAAVPLGSDTALCKERSGVVTMAQNEFIIAIFNNV